MLTETPEISLTIQLEGSHKPRFVYNKEKGKMERYYGRVIEHHTTKEEFFLEAFPGTTKAVKRLTLGETFVENAVKRPIKGFHPKKWYSLPIKDRVNKHVRDLVKAMLGLDHVDHTVYQWDFVPELTE